MKEMKTWQELAEHIAHVEEVRVKMRVMLMEKDAEIRRLKDENAKLVDYAFGLKKKLSAQCDDIKALKDENALLSGMIDDQDSLREEINSLTDHLQEMSSRNWFLETENYKVKKDLEFIENEYEELSQKVADLSEENEDLMIEIDDLNDQLENVQICWSKDLDEVIRKGKEIQRLKEIIESKGGNPYED